MTYVTPTLKAKSCTCPHCGVYAQFWWKDGKEETWRTSGTKSYNDNGLCIGSCSHCKGRMVWLVNAEASYLLWPIGFANAPLPHEAMPEDVKRDYEEARGVCNLSPRGSAALLRLAIQRLCKHLGGKGENINSDIRTLVQDGLPVRLQQALDVVRVTGNNAVHPGELVLDDNPEIVQSLFGLINLIVENRIAEPKRIDALYAKLPEGARAAIEKRDK